MSMDDTVDRNLDTLSRRLAELESATDTALAGGVPDPLPENDTTEHLSYAELTATNDLLRTQRGWTAIDLDAALTPDEWAGFDRWRARQRIEWDRDDVLAVGFATVLGVAAVWYDTAIDGTVAKGLGSTRKTGWMRAWERAGKRLPIDYTGPGFGGRAHRVRSPGHDLARPFEALRQIRAGEFRGVRWDYGDKYDVTVGGRFREVDSLAEALVLWAQHLAADVVTPMSLPLPGSSWLYELDNRALRKFAHEVYLGTAGNGLNVRSGLLTPSLSVITTEVILRTHVHARAYAATGSARLDVREQARRNELLLAAHSLVGAASAGKTLARMIVLDDRKGMALRHVNVPVLLRMGCLAVEVAHDRRTRSRAVARDWDELATGLLW
ncbi:hypothetical protein [Rhodococcus sp. IEGM 1307]|jgi:hypothetical protein|uniref:hypothetical protein n=1 Tax=Rhodococcus sp. IEGM 1307 TaxID=3047091 RepID=UPI0013C1DA65|nr:hypothetical protein [Rhodococcus sp. IEGM 1307]MDI9980027.1 hypothetical protein [Rhodococcus sp. IEGM 1307]NDV08687.1 hypothetical protein [Rhodococcus sp. IEGM 248]